MMRLVIAYYGVWSQPSTDVEGLTQFYGDTATFYGSNVSRTKIMEEKRKFSARWPIRHYTIKTNTLSVQCVDACSVTGWWNGMSPAPSVAYILLDRPTSCSKSPRQDQTLVV